MKHETKKKLLALVRNIGVAIAPLEQECYVNQFGMSEAREVRVALEMLQIKLAMQPET